MAKNNERRAKFKKLAKAPSSDHRIDVNNVEATFLGLATLPKENGTDPAYIALKYYQPDHQCFSDWSTDELSAFSKFVTTVSQQPWQQILRSGGKGGNKVGLGYTQHKDRSKLPKCQAVDNISEDINFFELRVTQKARVHGFRVKSTFFLVWLDRNHQIYPQ